jgi:signal peptidase I
MGRQTTAKKNILLWGRDIIIAFALIVILLFLFTPTLIAHDPSMENTLQDKDLIFISKPAYAFGGVKHGDIVVVNGEFVTDKREQSRLIKRVIGLPGDTVDIHSAGVYVNGILIDEPYTKQGITLGKMEPVKVPEGAVFLLGDNRQNSMDSREPEVGFVPMDDIAGKAVFRLFPLRSIGNIK